MQTRRSLDFNRPTPSPTAIFTRFLRLYSQLTCSLLTCLIDVVRIRPQMNAENQISETLVQRSICCNRLLDSTDTDVGKCRPHTLDLVISDVFANELLSDNKYMASVYPVVHDPWWSRYRSTFDVGIIC